MALEAVGRSRTAAAVAGEGKLRAAGHILRAHRLAPEAEVGCRTGLGHTVAAVGADSLLVADCNYTAVAVEEDSFLAAGRSQREHHIARQVVAHYMTAHPEDDFLAHPWCHMKNR